MTIPTPKSSVLPKKLLTLTVDTEAQAPRSNASDPLSHLIWGRHDGHSLGIGEMMDVADKHNVRMTFYVDYPEYDIYGDAILDVSREISRRGHNAELHIHPEFLDRNFGATRGLGATSKFIKMGIDESKAVVDYVADLHLRSTSHAPTSFRGGGYRYTPNILNALADIGLKTVSNDNATVTVGILPQKSRTPFLWENGLLEIPVTTAQGFKGLERTIPWNFNKGTFSNPRYSVEQCIERHLEFLTCVESSYPSSLPTLVMHSWSFWDMDDNNQRTIPRSDAVERFDGLVAALSSEYSIEGLDQVAVQYDSLRTDDLNVQAFP